ncbi:ODV-EC43 [Perigonia lusca single nucleopolyhedrovirus]|uniref:ODV-EC43 n=1 Tax=Perigonia lusca single nucleopolyhedrovirus TaxID=1675865 RepID=A0A0M3WNX3_9ABAC|nr:ODV-EC43 [Perigonia lusca single nucleopolyhedrovirus]AKN80592.1 ODV-EC43 [Perigonia lusca single nucleopolyhedrovirus]
MACPLNIKVCISESFFRFPTNMWRPRTTSAVARCTILWCLFPPTKIYSTWIAKSCQYSDRFWCTDKKRPIDRKRDWPKKNPNATIVYWNPISPIDEIGVGETRVFSVLLTNDLFYCNTMIVDQNAPLCPIEFRTQVNYKNLQPIETEVPLFYYNKLIDDNVNDFLLCFKRETPTMVKILNIKRILSIFEYRNVPARYTIYLPDDEVDSIFNKLMWERVRRLMKGDVNHKCMNINRRALQYLRIALDMLKIDNSSQAIVKFVRMFQPLILPYQIVPDVIIKLNTLEREKRVRLYCRNDSFAITSYGSVPNNMPDDNLLTFDYSEVNNNKYLYETRERIINDSKIDANLITIGAARYNYFF